MFDALLAHARHFIVHFQWCSCRQYHIGTLVFFVPYYHHKFLFAVRMLGYLISHKVMLGHLRLHLGGLQLVLQGWIFYFLATLCLANNVQGIVHITLYGIYQTWIFFQFTIPVIHQSHVLLRNLGWHTHFHHFDARSQFHHQFLLLHGILRWRNAVFHHHAFPCQSLLMSCSTHHLAQHFLHIIAIMLKVFLLWHIHSIFFCVIVCHSASVFAHRHHVFLHLLDEVIYLATQCLVFIRTDIFLHHLFIFLLVF